MKFEVIAKNGCGGGQCPTLYRSDDGRYFVQGNTVSPDISAEIRESVPAGEEIVELSAEMISAIKNI